VSPCSAQRQTVRGSIPSSIARVWPLAEPEELPQDLLEAGTNKWEKLALLERHLDAHKMTTCEAMVVAHEQITALDPEYVNLFTVQHNLFAGALLALSDEPAHLAVAREAKHGRARGCFALTEIDAGVYSGAVRLSARNALSANLLLQCPSHT
jgi:alkylation response protein AidB-like acyl-CoA dehydrogenase